MTNYGDYAPASLVVFNFNTASFADGSPITLAGSPALSVYKNSTTESTAGITLTVDYDSRTGMHHVAIDTSSDGTFYAAGNDFSVVITTGTVGGTSVVGRVVGSFSLNNRSALRPATAGRTLVVDTSGLADANAVKVGPTGSGTAQTARDLGASVLLSSGTGTGQLDFTAGVVKANVVQSLGTAITNEDFTVASATSSTVTLPTTYSSGASLPDDSRYQFCSLSVTGGTGVGQVVVLTTATGTARQYNVKSGTMPVQLDNTSKCTVLGTVVSNAAYVNSVSTSSVTTVNANLGTTQAVTFNANNFQKVSLNDILATTLTETSGQLAGGFKQFFNIASPTSTMNVITTVTTTTTATNLTNAATAGDLTATMKTSVQTAADAAITANALVLEIEADTDTLTAGVTVNAYAAGQDPYALVMKVAMTESYTTGAPTVEQAFYEVLQSLSQFSISGTTLTAQKRDKSTAAATWTLSDATNPTSRTRAT